MTVCDLGLGAAQAYNTVSSVGVAGLLLSFATPIAIHVWQGSHGFIPGTGVIKRRQCLETYKQAHLNTTVTCNRPTNKLNLHEPSQCILAQAPSGNMRA